VVFGRIVSVDFSKKGGRVKALAGFNADPVFSAFGDRVDVFETFSGVALPVVRLCDVEAPYGKNQFVDVHCLFPDPSADETLEESYNFAETDRYVAAARAGGAQIVFRLGESLDPYGRKLFVAPPRDLDKWARICERVVMHYNEGFAGGYKWNVKYWEIWNMPESPLGWQGGEEEFFELYTRVASHLKERFPKIKVGGYGSLGFSSLNRIDSDETFARAPEYASRFLSYLKARRAPLDFFSWYCFAESPEEITLHSQYARNLLDGAGFRRAASYIVGFNMKEAQNGSYRGYPADLAAAFITAQKSNVDMMICDSPRRLLGSYEVSRESDVFASAKSALSAFGTLYSLKSAAESLGDSSRELYTLAASDGSAGALLLVAREYEGKVEIRLKNADFDSFSVKRFYESATREPLVRVKEGIDLSGNKIVISVERNDIYLLQFTK